MPFDPAPQTLSQLIEALMQRGFIAGLRDKPLFDYVNERLGGSLTDKQFRRACLTVLMSIKVEASHLDGSWRGRWGKVGFPKWYRARCL